MYKYKYTGTGIMTVEIDKKRITVAHNHRTLPDTIELSKKVNMPGLELIEEDKKRKPR